MVWSNWRCGLFEMVKTAPAWHFTMQAGGASTPSVCGQTESSQQPLLNRVSLGMLLANTLVRKIQRSRNDPLSVASMGLRKYAKTVCSPVTISATTVIPERKARFMFPCPI